MPSHSEWLAGLSPWPQEFGLGRMRTLLAALGDPQLAYPAIHVVGTNGKSTATRTIEALLLAEGLSVGATVSPHVRSWSERITVDGEEADFEEAIGRVRPEAEAQEATQFEVLCAAAFAEFAARDVDVAVVEAGLGGRLDATNVLRSHVVLLTNVGLEHTDVLGATREEIAAEKLAVVGEGAVAVLPDREFASLAGSNVVVGGAREAASAFLGRPVEREVEVGLPGRLELRAGEVRDGAHNADGAAGSSRSWTGRLHGGRFDPARQGRRRDAGCARDKGAASRGHAVVERASAQGRRARPPRRSALRGGRDRAGSGRRARARPRAPARARHRFAVPSRRLGRERGTSRTMTKMRERVTVLTFALAVLGFIIGSAFGIGYLVGRLLL